MTQPLGAPGPHLRSAEELDRYTERRRTGYGVGGTHAVAGPAARGRPPWGTYPPGDRAPEGPDPEPHGAAPGPPAYGGFATHDSPPDEETTGDQYGDAYGEYDAYGDDGYGDAADEPYGDAYGDGEDDGEDDDLERRRGCRGALIALGVLAALGVIGALLAWRWVQHQIDPPGPPGETVIVEIPAGTSTGQIGRVLEAEGVISNATVWQ